jgi:Lipid A 3-O-deacylase (PagL).
MRSSIAPVLGLCMLSCVQPVTAAAIDSEWVGIRGGGSAPTISQDIDGWELLLRFRLPWQGNTHGWSVASHLNLGAGRFQGEGDSLNIVSAGPSVSLDRGRLSIDIGTAPTYVSEAEIAGRELGGHFQFTSHLGVYVQLLPPLAAGVRIQHTSNASLYHDNDGIDMLMLELRTRL